MSTAIVLASALLLSSASACTLAKVVNEPDADVRRSLVRGVAIITPFAVGLFWVAVRINS